MNHHHVVIPTYDNVKDIERCVYTLRKYTPPHKLIIVNSGTSSLAYLDSDLYVRHKSHLGFAGACNIGIRLALGRGADFVTLLNDDVELIHSEWFDNVLSCFRDFQDVVGVAPLHLICIKEPYKSEYSDADWRRFVRQDRYDETPFYCVTLHRRAFDEIGLLDEAFGLGGMEGYDYCRRAKERRLCIISTGRSWVWHWWNVTRLKLGYDKMEEAARNHWKAKYGD